MPVTATFFNGTATPRTSGAATVPAHGTVAVAALADADAIALLQFDGIGVVKHASDEIRRLALKVGKLGRNPGASALEQ